jgi:hypothetical protein
MFLRKIRVQKSTGNGACRFFSSDKSLSYVSATEALQVGYVLLLSRAAFSSEAEVRESYPPKPGEEAAWRESARPWYENRRHMFLACINPVTGNILTSSSEPDKTHTPWTLGFCSENMPLTQLDMDICQSSEKWDAYNVAAVALSPTDYSPHDVTDAIQKLRENRNPCEYSIDPENGYDCQTATRDVLSVVNHGIDPKTLILPEHTDILAYYSEQVFNELTSEHEAEQKSASMK